MFCNGDHSKGSLQAETKFNTFDIGYHVCLPMPKSSATGQRKQVDDDKIEEPEHV